MTIDKHNIDSKLNANVRQYLGTALWAETVNLTDDSLLFGVDECDPLDSHFDIYDFTSEAVDKAQADIDEFFKKIEHLDTSEYDDSDLMHDFWLTRNGHGAGFFDGDYDDDLGQALTKVCEEFNQVYIWIDSDGSLYYE